MRLAIATLALLLAGCGSSERTAAENSVPAKPPAPKPKILMFYPSQGIAAKGEKILICYGVEDAASVTIDPPIEELKPSFNRCLETVAQKSGKYTLKVEGKDGGTVERSFELKVEGVAARSPAQKSTGRLIHFFTGSRKEVRRGEQLMLCYEVSEGADVVLNPDPHMPLGKPKGCVQVSPQGETTYKLTAKGTNGGSEAGEVHVRVLP